MSGTTADLRVRREALGLSRAWVARRLGVAEQTVSRWESGARAIPGDVWPLLDEAENRADILVHTILVRRRREAEANAKLGRGGGQAVAVTAYATDADMWAERPELAPWPASWHRAALGRLRIELGPIPVTYAYGPHGS